MNEIIWLIREPRSGGTWLAHALANRLKRKYVFFDPQLKHLAYREQKEFFKNRTQRPNDSYSLLNTHLFDALEGMSNYRDPFVIRCIRKDAVQQCLSFLCATLTEWQVPNLYNDTFIKENRKRFNQLLDKKITVTEDLVQWFFDLKNHREQQWKEAEGHYRTCTVTYESLLDSVDLPELDIFGLTMKDPGITLALPDYKKDLIANYDQTIQWILDKNINKSG